MQLFVVNPVRHGAELGGHVTRLNFDLALIPSFNFVTGMEIKYKHMDFESVLTFWDIVIVMFLLDTAMWRILHQLVVYLDLTFAFCWI